MARLRKKPGLSYQNEALYWCSLNLVVVKFYRLLYGIIRRSLRAGQNSLISIVYGEAVIIRQVFM